MAIPNRVERLDVVAMAPHPDDLEIVCGGTLAKLVSQGYRVGIFDLTSGEPTPRGSVETRIQEAKTAAEALGVATRVNVGLQNRELMDSPANRYAMAAQLRRYRPDVLITMAGRTPAASPDHHQGHMLVEASRFYSQLTKWDERFDNTKPFRVPHLVYAPVPFDAELRQWQSSFVVDITDTIEQKMKSIAAYASQFDGPRLAKVQHYVKGYNAAMGGRCGFAYGEFFALPHPVPVLDMMQLMNKGKSGPAPLELPGQDNMPQG